MLFRSVEVRKVAAKTVEVTFIDEETKEPVGEKVNVEVKDGMINTGRLTAPEAVSYTHLQQNSLEETQQWLTEGGVISAVKSFYFLEEHDALGGLEKVGTMLDKARYSNSLSSKMCIRDRLLGFHLIFDFISYFLQIRSTRLSFT